MSTLAKVINIIKEDGEDTRDENRMYSHSIISELRGLNSNITSFMTIMMNNLRAAQLAGLRNNNNNLPSTSPNAPTPQQPQPTGSSKASLLSLAGMIALGLAGAISSFFDEIVAAIRIPRALKFVGEFVSDISKIMGRLGRGLLNIFKPLQRAVLFFQNTISRIRDSFIELGKFLTKTVVDISKYFKALFSPTGTVGSFFTKVNNLLKPVVAFIGTVFKSISAFVKNMAVFNVFREIGAVIGSTGKSLSGFTDIFKRIADFIKQLSFVQRIVRVLGTAFRFLRFALGPISMVIFAFVDFIKGFIKGFGEGGLLGGIKEGLLEIFRGLVTKPLDLLKDLVSWAAGKLGFKEFEGMLDSFSFTDMFNQFITALEDIFEDVGKWFSTLFSDPVAAIETLAEDTLGMFKDFGKFVYDKALKPAGDYLGGLFDDVVETFKENFAVVGNWFSSIADKIMFAAEEVWINAIADVKKNFLSLFNYLAALPDKILIGAQQLAIDMLGGTRIGRGVLSSLGITQGDVDRQRADLASSQGADSAMMQRLDAERAAKLADLEARKQAASLATITEGGVGAGGAKGNTVVAPTTVGPTYTGPVYNGPVTVNNDSSTSFGLNPNDKAQMAYGF